jgi:PAS domain S-box-containing protein
LPSRAGIQIFPLKTQDRHFGFLLLKLEERERYARYEPFVSNLANSLAVNIDRQWQKERLEAANVELRRYREHLEELVRERTAELQLGLKREHHLNAVLRAIRNVNQLIVREMDRDRLLQHACGILAETRGFRCVWIVCLGADGRVKAMAEAGIGPAFVGLRSQLERGELPECCRRALASEGPAVLANPVVNCAACPLATEYRDTAGIAAPLRHEGRTYGVLIAEFPAEMAADAEEISIFAEVAADLAFALHDIEMERQRKQAEQALQESDALLKAAINILPVGLWIIDAEGKIVTSSTAAQRIWAGVHYVGIDQLGEYKGWRTDSGKLIEAHEWAGARALEKGEISIEEEVEIECFDGTHKIILDSAVPLRKSDGSIGGAITINQDITERKKAEEALHAASLYARSLIETSLDPLVTISPEGKITDINRATEFVTGVPREELIGRDFTAFFTEPEKARAGYQQVFAEGLVRDYPLTIRNTSGATTDVLYNATVYKDEAGQVQGVFAAARDITERKQAEQALRQKMEELHASNNELEQFNRASVGRELRMIELKEEINELCRRLGEAPRHATDQRQTDGVPGAGPATAPPGGGGIDEL